MILNRCSDTVSKITFDKKGKRTYFYMFILVFSYKYNKLASVLLPILMSSFTVSLRNTYFKEKKTISVSKRKLGGGIKKVS